MVVIFQTPFKSRSWLYYSTQSSVQTVPRITHELLIVARQYLPSLVDSQKSSSATVLSSMSNEAISTQNHDISLTLLYNNPACTSAASHDRQSSPQLLFSAGSVLTPEFMSASPGRLECSSRPKSACTSLKPIPRSKSFLTRAFFRLYFPNPNSTYN